MKVFWKLLVVIGVLSAAATAVMLWMSQRKKNMEFDEECCVWDEDACDGCGDEIDE